MLNIQEVVNFLNEHLNTNENITFNVKAEVGESDKESLINGILRTANSKTTPIANYVENRYTFVVELSVPTARTNKVFLKAQDIVGGFVDSYDGTKVEFTNGSGTINCSLGKPETFKVAYNVGDCTPLYFTIDMVYTESGVMSIDKKWYLSADGTTFYEIPYETESVVVNKEGITRKVDFDKYTKTLLTGQTKFYKFKFPYQNTELGNMLMKDILNGDFKKQYTLKYVDGINYIEDDLTNPPFETKVSIFMSGDANSQVVNVGKFDITFTDVDDGNTETKYYLGLIDWQFDLSGEDTRYFKTQQEQQLYFESLVTSQYSGTGWQQIKAPNLNNIYITSQVFPNENNMNIFDLVRKNYAIIKVVKTEDGVTTTQYIYYGASNCQIGADGQVTYDLEEDTVQTLFMNRSLTFGSCFIERSHLDRYKQISGTYYYDWRSGSALYEKENISSTAKKTTKKEKLKIRYNNDDTKNNWLNDNIECWEYVFISPGSYKIGTPASTQQTETQIETMSYFEESGFGGIICMCAPIYKTSKRMTVNSHFPVGDTPAPITVYSYGFNLFFKNNDALTSNVIYSVKYSIMPPFEINGTIDGNDNFNCSNSLTYGMKTNIGLGDNGVILVTDQPRIPIKLEATTQFINGFTTAQARTNSNEPKLYNEDYSIYNIYYGGQTYQMPISKSSNTPKFIYYEALTPDVTKFYLTYDNTSQNDSGMFSNYTTKDFTGLTGTIDLSIWFASSQLASWLSTNKNNLQIFENNQELSRIQAGQNIASTALGAFTGAVKQAGYGAAGGAVVGGAMGAATGALGGALTGIVSGVGSLIGGVNNYFANEQVLENQATNRELTIDNMRQSPASLGVANSNSLFVRLVDELGIYIELQETILFEQQQIKDHLKRYGYTVNRNGNVRYYMESGIAGKRLARQYWVYIKAILSSMSGISMSTQERMNLRQRFENGIRFWDTDTIDYTQINCEAFLIE